MPTAATAISGFDQARARAPSSPPARDHDPHLVAAPHRTDRRGDPPPLLARAPEHELQRAGAEVEPVEHDVGDYHHAEQNEPHGPHQAVTVSRLGVAVTSCGPRAT